MRSYTKNVRISPKKLMPIVEVVKNMDAKQALDVLKFMPKKGADILYKSLASAVANAESAHGQKKENLEIMKLIVTKGIVMKRGNAVSRGRYHPMIKRTSNVRIELQSK